MSSWKEFATSEPDLAERAMEIFCAQKHMTLATLRRDGSPRISGTEAVFDGDDLQLGMMPGSLKALDLLRDPRFALHAPALDPPPESPERWAGDAKIAGRAVADPIEDPADTSHRFKLDIAEVVLIKVGVPADHLVIESWTPAGGLRIRRRR